MLTMHTNAYSLFADPSNFIYRGPTCIFKPQELVDPRTNCDISCFIQRNDKLISEGADFLPRVSEEDLTKFEVRGSVDEVVETLSHGHLQLPPLIVEEEEEVVTSVFSQEDNLPSAETDLFTNLQLQPVPQTLEIIDLDDLQEIFPNDECGQDAGGTTTSEEDLPGQTSQQSHIRRQPQRSCRSSSSTVDDDLDELLPYLDFEGDWRTTTRRRPRKTRLTEEQKRKSREQNNESSRNYRRRRRDKLLSKEEELKRLTDTNTQLLARQAKLTKLRDKLKNYWINSLYKG